MGHKQSKLMKVDWIHRLHGFLAGTGCDSDKCMAGQALFTLYGRARWMGAQSTFQIDEDLGAWDHGYLDCLTSDSKTSTTVTEKNTFLPLVIPLPGVSFKAWYRPWMEARLRCGLVLALGTPMLPRV